MEVAATVALVAWAHGLTGPQRAGRDLAFATGFVVWVLLGVVCLVAWTGAATATARRIELRPGTRTAHAWIACAVTATMVVMTVATAAWWAAPADAAPWFLA